MPAAMHEMYENQLNNRRVEGPATYSNFRAVQRRRSTSRLRRSSRSHRSHRSSRYGAATPELMPRDPRRITHQMIDHEHQRHGDERSRRTAAACARESTAIRSARRARAARPAADRAATAPTPGCCRAADSRAGVVIDDRARQVQAERDELVAGPAGTVAVARRPARRRSADRRSRSPSCAELVRRPRERRRLRPAC